MTARPFCAAALAALIASGGVGVAFAQDAVRLRTWEHSDFARMVFDWPASVGYSAAIDGQTLTVRFDRPLETDLGPVRERLGGYIESVSAGPEGRVLSFALTGRMVLGQFTNENSIVIDLRRAPGETQQTAQAEAAEAQPTQPPVTGDAPPTAVPLGVRVGAHPDYTRVVFDWTEQTGYTVTRNGRAATLTFERAAIIDTAAVAGDLPPGILLVSSLPSTGQTRVTFAIPESAELRDFSLESRVVFDVLAPADVRNAQAAPLPPGQVPQVAQASAEPEGQPEAEPPAPDPEPETAVAPVEPAPTEEEAAARQDAALAEAVQDGTIEFREGLDPTLPQRTPEQRDEAAREQQAQPERDPIPAPEQAEAAPAEPAPAAEQAAPEQAATQTAPEEPAGPPLFDYTFPFPEEVGAAVFRRGGNVWMIFDYAAPIENLADLRTKGAPAVERLDQLPIGNATVLRANIPDQRVNARARREGFDWVIEFRVAPQAPAVQVPIDADVTGDIGPHLSMPSEVPGAALNVPDPDMEDSMRVATLRESGMGMDGHRRYPEFELLATAQGVVLTRLSDQVLLDRNFDGFQISAPDGLAISGVAPEAPVSSGPILSSRRLFDLAGLMRGPQDEFEEQRGALFRSLAEVPEEKLDEARLAYAGFMMAHGRGHEALGILRVVERDNEALMNRPQNQALQAASAVLARRSTEALERLNDPRLDGFAEAAIWRGAALALDGDPKAAHDAFRAGDSLLARYPFPLRGRLGLLRIESAFQNRDLAAARSWIENLEQERTELGRSEQAALDYQRARLAVASQDLDLAEELFLEVMDSGDRKSAYFAERAYIAMARKQGLMDDEEALERYERLRYAWRGGLEELSLLRTLGELYLEQPDYFKGLDVYRTAVKYFPDNPQAEELAGEMAEIFADLFLNGEADTLPPLRAIALYEEFKELTPAGEKGDRLIEDIADRLAAVDLLPEAAVKLEELLANEERIPPGEERVRLSSKLALIYLLDDLPEKAEETLANNRLNLDLFNLDPGLEADRNRLLARAKFQQGEYDDAIKELAGDVSLEADLIRRDLYRKTENWQESAKVLQRLAGNPPEDPAAGVEGQTARYVINWAVALFQNNDREGLTDLVDLWGPAMANSSLSGVFDYITDRTPGPASDDVLSTVDQLIGAERFDAFLAAYEDRLFAPQEPAAVEASARSF